MKWGTVYLRLIETPRPRPYVGGEDQPCLESISLLSVLWSHLVLLFVAVVGKNCQSALRTNISAFNIGVNRRQPGARRAVALNNADRF
jgi:hypothetical protein